LRITLLAITASVLLSVVPVSAQALMRHYQLNIPRQPLDTALKEFAHQTGLQVARFSDRVDGSAVVGPVSGTLSLADALKSMLGSTGLSYRIVNERTVAIVKPGAEAAATSSPPENVENEAGKPDNNVKSFWDRLRLAQASPGAATEDASVKKSEQGLTKDSGQAAQLEEIIVTAQKRAERLIDTPQSVSVLSADTIANLGAVQFSDFANTVPGLSFTTLGAGHTQISLRGVTTGQDVSPTVGVYVDDVPFGSSTAFAQGAQLALDVGLFDIDRIEVLRGPQGTLYGASTMGGLLKYVTKQPDTNSFRGDAQGSVSGTEDGGLNYNAAGAVNLPLVAGKLALRATGFESHGGGYIDNAARHDSDVNRSDIYGGRLDLLFVATDALSIRLDTFVQDISREGEGTVDYTFSGQPQYGTLGQYRPTAEPFSQRFELGSITVDYDFQAAKLVSISSYQSSRESTPADASALYIPLFSNYLDLFYSGVGIPDIINNNKFTEELRLASQGAGPWEWLVGGFYTRENSTDSQWFSLYDPAGQPAPNDLYNASFVSRYKEYAAFGDLTYHFNSKLDVSGGVRYAHNDQAFTQIGSGLLVSSLPTNYSGGGVVTYLGDLRYHFTDQATGYLRYATGYRPGGPNFVLNDPVTGRPVAPTTFQADHLRSYEGGVKAETADRRFAIDAAVYYIDWSNIQIVASRNGVGFRVNAPGGATVRGAELSLTARPISDLTFTGAFSYQNAKLSQGDADLGAASGERLPNVPRFTGTFNSDYALPMGRSTSPTVGLTLRYVTDRMASFDESGSYPQYRLPAYTTLDLRNGYVFGPVNLQLFVHNVFDERGQLSAYTPFGSTRVAIMQPRTIGISATTHF